MYDAREICEIWLCVWIHITLKRDTQRQLQRSILCSDRRMCKTEVQVKQCAWDWNAIRNQQYQLINEGSQVSDLIFNERLKTYENNIENSVKQPVQAP
jgi:hypothetical protein